MDAKVVYWTGAWLNFSALFLFAALAVRRVRGGVAPAHRRYMSAAAWLVLLFLLSYVAKLMLLGREDMSVWSSLDVNVLRFHETCVLVMCVGGAISLWLGRRLRATRGFTRDREDPVADGGLVRTHRMAGRAAVVCALLGWLSAFFVLVGMYQRAGESVTRTQPDLSPVVVAAMR